MSGGDSAPNGPDFAAGLPVAQAPAEGMLGGHVGGEPVLLTRFNGQWRAFGGACTHYGGALAEGLVAGDTVRCPLHHACFSLRTGEALAAPAFDALDAWKVEIEGDMLFVREKLEAALRADARGARTKGPQRIVIVGGGAAGFAAAEMLRRRGYEGDLALLSADADPPCDRPNLSKDYLAGTAPEDWIPLKSADFYLEHAIGLRTGVEVARIAPDAREVIAVDGRRFAYDALLLATGAEPVRLPTPGFDQPNVRTLRSLADARALIAAAQGAGRVAVIGASFIGLEVAASLRARGLEVHVVAPETVPMERVLGRDLGEFVRALHEENGVVFHLGQTADSFADGRLRLSGGGEVAADLVLLGVGVRPRLDLAAAAGLTIDKGVVVDAFFETSAPGIFAAGDIARYPDALTGQPIRVEHWVAAERQGQAAAMAMLGERRRFIAPPYFWSQHYDLAIRYVGHAERFDRTEVDGAIASGDATVRFWQGDQLVAAASLGRDHESLEIAAEMERRADAA